MGVAGSIFELQPSNFGEIHIFKDVQMIVKSFFYILNGIKVSKNQFQQPIQHYRDPRFIKHTKQKDIQLTYTQI